MAIYKLKIDEIEDKKTEKGVSFLRVKTSDGWMSCFDENAAEIIRKNVGKILNIDLVTNAKGFKNIKVAELAEDGNLENYSKGGRKVNTATMYTSYAKDIFCSLLDRVSQSNFEEKNNKDFEKLMAVAVNVVKMARDNFEEKEE